MPDYSLVKYRGAWAIYWRADGKPVRRSTGCTSKADAQVVLDEVVRQEQAAPVGTFAPLWERYKTHLGERFAAKSMRYESVAVLPHFGHLQPENIESETTDAYIALRRALGRKDSTILTELNRVAATLNWAMGKRLIARVNALTFPPRPQPKDRYFTRAEVALLLDACLTPHTKLFMVLAITTGARLRALLDLTWDRVNFERGLIDLRLPGHIGKPRSIVPLNGSARAMLLEAKPDARCDHVISWGGERVLSVKKTLANTAARAKVTGVTAHVFRHTAAVWMAEAGRSMAEIAQFLGHTDSRITERVYARYSPDYLRLAAAALEVGLSVDALKPAVPVVVDYSRPLDTSVLELAA